MGSQDSHTVQSRVEVLFSHMTVPFHKCFAQVEVHHFAESPIDNFEVFLAGINVVSPHGESEFEFSAPKAVNRSPDHIKLTLSLLLQALVHHPLLELTAEDQAFSVILCVEFWDLLILLQEHHWITSEFEPARKGVFGFPLVLVYQQISQTIDRSKLIDVASSDKEHLIDGLFFSAIEHSLQGLFELSGRQKFDVHSVHSAHTVASTLV